MGHTKLPDIDWSAETKTSDEIEKELSDRKKSEMIFRGLLESAPDAMVITSGDGRILMVNAQAETIFGYNRNEIIGNTVEFLIPDRFRHNHVHHREKYVENPKVRSMGAGMDLFGKRKDGTEFPVEVSLSPMPLEDGDFLVMSAIRDTTQQKQIEAEIKKVNENLEVLVSERTRKLEDALNNERIVRLEMVQNQNRLKLLTEISEIFASSLDYFKTLVLLANRLVPDVADWCTIEQVESDGSFTCLAASHIDSAKISTLYELKKRFPPSPTLPNGIYNVLKTQKASLLAEINDDYISGFAKNPEHSRLIKEVGIKSAIIIPLLLREKVFGILTMALTEGSYNEKDFEFIKEVGRRATMAIDNAKLYQELQEVNSDLEQRVTRRTLELEAINKELESFSYSVSHDLRAPLRSIDGFSNKIQKDYSSHFDDQANDYFNRIMNASRKMGVLIDDLLKLARLSRVEMKIETTNMSDIAETILNDFKENNPERIAEFHVQQDMIVLADRNLIQIALQNLLGNAWKYSKNQSHTIIEFQSFKKDDETIYLIRDNGVGFDMKYVDKLFGAFQRLHNISEFEGTGIGLATVQRVIRRHHGNIWVESEINKGTTFYFTLNQ